VHTDCASHWTISFDGLHTIITAKSPHPNTMLKVITVKSRGAVYIHANFYVCTFANIN